MIKSEIRTITPEIAAEMLGRNTHNRNLRPTVVARFARDIAEGRWDLNGESIKFSDTDVILDGQHRLQAVVESGKPIKTIVVTGLPAIVQETVDRGTGRNLSDALRLRGETDVISLASVITAALLLSKGMPALPANWPSGKEALRFFEEHPNLKAAQHAGERIRHTLGCSAGLCGGLFWAFNEIDDLDADEFFARLETGAGLATTSPILKLREWIMADIRAPRRASRTRFLAMTIKAWNAYRRGDLMVRLQWSTGGANPDTFPKPQ
jgi:hypothetical protein